MLYLGILIAVVLFSLILRLGSSYLFLVIGIMILFHPLLISKQQIMTVSQLFNVIFILLLSVLVIEVIKKIAPFTRHDRDLAIIDAIKKHVGAVVGNVISDIIRKRYASTIKIVVYALVAVLLFWKVGALLALFWLLFLVYNAYQWDSKYIAGIALTCLCMCPLFLILKNEFLAETFAMYVYYLLVFYMLLQIVEYRRKSRFTGNT
ncbi:MAG: hypothetical protein V1907_04125 [Candidatus Kerfeldbacteria bacterium]